MDFRNSNHNPYPDVRRALLSWPLIDLGLRFYVYFNVTNTQHRPHLPPRAAAARDGRNCDGKVCTPRGFATIWHCILCIDPTTCTIACVVCFVLPSCCTTAGGEPVALLPNTFVCFMITYNRYNIYVHLILVLIRLDELLNLNNGRSAIGAEMPILIPVHKCTRK